MLAVGVVLTPAAAVAAVLSTVRLVAPGGAPAAVTQAGQVDAAATIPASFRAFHDYDLFASRCVRVYSPPAGYALVLQSITIDVYDNGGVSGPGSNVRVATNAACDRQLADLNPSTVGAASIVLSPGVVVRAGTSLYAIGDNGTDAELFGFGYLEPAADAPTGTSPQSDGANATPFDTPRGDAHVLRPFLGTQWKGRTRP